MGRENIMFFQSDDESYTMVDQYLHSRPFYYEDSHNYYDIDVDNYSKIHELGIITKLMSIENDDKELC